MYVYVYILYEAYCNIRTCTNVNMYCVDHEHNIHVYTCTYTYIVYRTHQTLWYVYMYMYFHEQTQFAPGMYIHVYTHISGPGLVAVGGRVNTQNFCSGTFSLYYM